jgi:hypothetical protein
VIKTQILLLSAWLVAHSRLLSRHSSYRTFYREVKAAGFDYLPACRKGVLRSRDRTQRKAFAQQCKKILSTKPGFFWRNIAFYSDRVSSVYKTQPLSDALDPRGCVYGLSIKMVCIWTKYKNFI